MSNNDTSIYHKKANGKLLLTSEYFILDGASGWAMPTQYGQKMIATPTEKPIWQAFLNDKTLWLETAINSNVASNSNETTLLFEILNYIKQENPEQYHKKINHSFQLFIDFNRAWGLGSSSTFIALIADFFEIDAYKLNHTFFKGSGYDIACAFASEALLYTILDIEVRSIENFSIAESIKPHLFFIYTGQKQNSREAIQYYRNLPQKEKDIAINDLNFITRELIRKQDYKDWLYFLKIHEDIISKVLKLEKISQTLAKELPFFSKSLGAWGGDFILCLANDEPSIIKNRISETGFDTYFEYKDIIL
jgi:mevalonate kinase